MIENTCERESAVDIAARSGEWPADLERHIAACSACAETGRVAQLFQQAAKFSAGTPPPPAAIVWQRLEARRRQIAIRRATQCVTLMSILAGIYAAVLAAWYLPRLWHTQLATDLSPLSGEIVFVGVLTAILAVFLGSCCFAYLGSRTSFKLRT